MCVLVLKRDYLNHKWTRYTLIVKDCTHLVPFKEYIFTLCFQIRFNLKDICCILFLSRLMKNIFHLAPDFSPKLETSIVKSMLKIFFVQKNSSGPTSFPEICLGLTPKKIFLFFCYCEKTAKNIRIKNHEKVYFSLFHVLLCNFWKLN